MRLILATGVDRLYAEKKQFGLWCESVTEHHSPAIPIVFGYDHRPRLNPEYAKINVAHVPEEHMRVKFRNYYMAHGEFLNWYAGEPQDVIVFTDADEVMQRQWMPDELRMLNSWPQGAVGMAHNCGGTMLHEAGRLEPKEKFKTLRGRYFEVMDQECYACGVMVVRQKTYRLLYERCVDLWPEVKGCFGHYSEEQWLINLVVHLYRDLKPMVLPWTFHAHDVNGAPPGAKRFPNGLVTVNNIPALFRHFVRRY